MNSNKKSDEIVIVTQLSERLYVWQGRYGWSAVDAAQRPWEINRGHQYSTQQSADNAIRRMMRKYPDSPHWRNAKALSLEDARRDDNVLGLRWTTNL